MRIVTHPHFKKTGGCENCRKYIYGEVNGKVAIVGLRRPEQATDEFLKCGICPIRHNRDFDWCERCSEIITSYADCRSGMGQFCWPEPRLDDNQLYIRTGFRLVDRLLAERNGD